MGIFFTARLCFWGECVCSLDFQVKMHTTVTRGGPHCLTPFSKSLSAQGNLHVCTSVIHFLFLKPLTHVLALEIPQVSTCHEARQRTSQIQLLHVQRCGGVPSAMECPRGAVHVQMCGVRGQQSGLGGSSGRFSKHSRNVSSVWSFGAV